MIEGKKTEFSLRRERRPRNSYIKQIKNDARLKTLQELK